MKITETLIKKSCSSTIYKRGLEYFKEGRVHLRKREDKLITAVVDGSELYNVRIKLNDTSVEECFCTCPYYETMNSVCKHIVATLKQRQKEIDEGENYVDENDKIAKTLCSSFAAKQYNKEQLYAKFFLHIHSIPPESVCYGMSMDINGVKLHGIENFLDSFLNGKKFKIDRYVTYDPQTSEFPLHQNEIINILAETYESRKTDTQIYMKAAYQTSFGSMSAKRIFPLLKYVDFHVNLDGMSLGSIQILEENPDIIIDVDSTDGEINMTVSDRGFALCYDGEWFLYENTIYHTDKQWRDYFMPIYHALASDGRTQISFKGNNIMMFATHVLPEIKDKHGIITNGIDDMIVDAKPNFEIYFDTHRDGITAVIKANYGSISVILPGEVNTDSKIVVRDYTAENDILSHFTDFTVNDGVFLLTSDIDIFAFLSNEITQLDKKAVLYHSGRFDSLKIINDINIKATVRYKKDIDLLETDFESDLSREQISGILNAVKLKRPFYRLSNGNFIALDKSKQREVFDLLEQLDFSYDDIKNGRKSISKYHALYLNSIQFLEKDSEFIRFIDDIKNREPLIPKGLEDILRGYQYSGVQWLTQLSYLGFGGILADDMGLGKTLQVIAYIHGIRDKKPVLIVAPSALIYNWQSEINKFTPDASSLIIDGNKNDRKKLINKINDYEFIITSYPLLRRDISQYKEVEFEYCFIDEAQHIKNPKTMNARSVKKINARHKFALTGTPIENSLIELWSIFDFIMPGYLYSLHDFRSRYEIPLLKDGNTSEMFRKRIKPFMLRRMKSDVLNELPEKIENTIFAELTPEQKDMYSAYLALAKDETMKLLNKGRQDKIRILTLLMRLRQICCHPKLFDENYSHDSGKLDLLMELVTNAVDSGHRILVFSQFTSMLDIINERMKDEKIPCFYISGKTPSYERAEMADRFNGGERDVLLISLKAGGTGLNLIGADMVIHYDPWWNPAVMDQASDRAYRIGQTKAVQVIRLASKGTIEEKILKLQENKRNLADDIVRVNTETFKDLSNEEILSLFS